MSNKIKCFFKKYRKGFLTGIVASIFIVSMMLVADVSASYGAGLKEQELSLKYEERDFLINHLTEWIFIEYKIKYEESPYYNFYDVVEKANDIMDEHYQR